MFNCFVNTYPLLIYANIDNMLVGFGIFIKIILNEYNKKHTLYSSSRFFVNMPF